MSEPIVVELKRGILQLTGRDRVRFLHNMCTNDIKSLKPGKGCLAAMVNRQGKMVGVFHVKSFEDRFLLDGEPDGMAAVRDTMQRYIVMDDVTITELTRRVVGVLGMSGPDLRLFQFTRDGERLVARTPVGHEVWEDPSLKATRGGEEAYEKARIELGWPRWGLDMTSDHLPMEAGLEPIAISYTKGCYIGQEVIQRVKTYSEPPQMIVSFVADSPIPLGPILVDGKGVGAVTSTAGLIALGMVRKEFKAPGTRVTTGSASATVQRLRWHESP